MNLSSIIEAKNLTRVYPLGPVGVVALKDVTFTVSSGEFVLLKGNSGSGKSTLLALLGGLDRPTSGQLHVAGIDVVALSERGLTQYRRRVVGIVFQSFHLLPTLTVLENVCLPALLAGASYEATRAKALHWLQWLDMQDRLHHLPGELSGGEAQRTAIARALINDPFVILADEPTGNLDSRNGARVVDILGSLHRDHGRTIIMATHSSIADDVATRQLCLQDGTIVNDQCLSS
ncbi:ABC transporter ATP-binding protein [Desulfosoma caldarium]|uniref:Putative ABC transport system ATP-binding protein n=1 Tax=Desulfosoma caldarium TaxID=610254 RepID=A0A3N1UTS1_9BACT|nr:ABC transporter ATP-binding protein [Desulfosoma caldarium]ROQ92120.1 putative ABC transport system ATP-binding protein [Desulfosoma caldarium]